MCGVSEVTCGVSEVTCGVSEVTCGVSEVTCGVSEVTCGVSVPDYTSHSRHVLCIRYSRGGQSRAPGTELYQPQDHT